MRRFTLVHGMFLSATCGFLLAAAGAGCGGDDPPPPPPSPDMAQPAAACTAAQVTGSSNKLATDSLKLPKSTGGSTFTYDFDGDGKPENQLKNLINVVALSGLDIQASVDTAVQNGEAVLLTDVKTADLMSSSCSSFSFALAEAPMGWKPKFDGSDMFKVGAIMSVTLFGGITAGKMSTTPSKDQTAANEQKIQLTLPLGMGNTLPLALRGAHVEGTLAMEGGILKIKNGVIHGVLAQKDIDGQIVPLVANLLTDLIHKDTKMGVPGDTAKAIIGLFEQKTGAASKAKCMANAADCCGFTGMAHPDTCKIVAQEVKDSSIGGVLSPDVQVLDDQGNWKPVPGGKMLNGMSVGLGFTSVKASF